MSCRHYACTCWVGGACIHTCHSTHTHTAIVCVPYVCGGAHLVPVCERGVRGGREEDLALRAWEAAVKPQRDAVQLADGRHAVRDLLRVGDRARVRVLAMRYETWYVEGGGWTVELCGCVESWGCGRMCMRGWVGGFR